MAVKQKGELMKKRICLLVTAVSLIIVMLAGCSSSNDYASESSYNYKAASESGALTEKDMIYGYVGEADLSKDTVAVTPATEEEAEYTASTENTAETTGSLTGRKLIKRVNMDIETLEFEQSVDTIEKYVSSFGGYIETSSVSNSNYYNSSSYSPKSRRANYTIRIPGEKLDAFIGQVGNIGNVVNQYMSTEDITLAYVDLEARTKSLEIQQERLLDLLGKAETVEDIISLEDRLSTVRYQIESQKSTLKNYDNLVEFSTVTIDLNEVIRITSPEPTTTGERISSGLSDTFYDIGVGLENFAVWFLINLPYIIIWAVIIAAVIFVIIRGKKVVKKHNEKKQAKLQAEWEAKQAKLKAEEDEIRQAKIQAEEENKQTNP